MNDDDLEVLTSSGAHAGHFLSRTMRVSALEMDRAMGLYHHSAVVRKVLAEYRAQQPGRLPDARRADTRVAIALGDQAPSGHVIVTAGGDFVTCLAADMRLSNLPVLPYGLFAPAIAQEDARRSDVIVERDQLARLSVNDFVQGMVDGPGALTREMAAIIARRPQTYLMPAWIVVQRVNPMGKQLDQIRAEFVDCHWQGRLPERGWQKVEGARMQLQYLISTSLHVMAAVDDEWTNNTLRTLAGDPTLVMTTAMFGLAQRPWGGAALEEISRDPARHEMVRGFAIYYIGLHAHYHPRNLAALAQRAHDDPPRGIPEPFGRSLAILQSFAGRSADELENDPNPDFTRLKIAPADSPADNEWLFDNSWYTRLAQRRATLVDLFPPAERAAAVRAAWEMQRRKPRPLPKKPEIAQVVRRAPRVSRNEPCPCGSGRKYKHCCQGREANSGHLVPQPQEQEQRR